MHRAGAVVSVQFRPVISSATGAKLKFAACMAIGRLRNFINHKLAKLIRIYFSNLLLMCILIRQLTYKIVHPLFSGIIPYDPPLGHNPLLSPTKSLNFQEFRKPFQSHTYTWSFLVCFHPVESSWFLQCDLHLLIVSQFDHLAYQHFAKVFFP